MSSIAKTFICIWLSAAALMPVHSEAGQREQSQEGTMQTTQRNIQGPRLSSEDVRRVAPALEAYTQDRLYGDVWKRPGLTPRDRSLITVAALIARDQTPALTSYLNQALENGVAPREISETITHLAFYAGWTNAFGAVSAARDVFAQRGIGADQLPTASVHLLPLDEAAEARAKRVGEQFGTVAPGVVQYTTDVLFRDLWRRPDLAPRDRSLITVSALIATGQAAQLSYHDDNRGGRRVQNFAPVSFEDRDPVARKSSVQFKPIGRPPLCGDDPQHRDSTPERARVIPGA